MEKWIVVCCTGREISKLGTFDSFKDAQKSMEEDFFNTFKEMLPDEIYDKDENCDYSCGHQRAWLDTESSVIDWQILKV